ncbi:hypothetical protein POM88_000862 [Heracleum sosnowskyi]|uniref:Uncharacterized protein n=1 Tax=Heracleum sosnowskyi TaxID=360622 RepID=A0AAD8JBG3_9APIA|nr:hypothetical protein POM88_000862 [Heracleum sosnowskyi]
MGHKKPSIAPKVEVSSVSINLECKKPVNILGRGNYTKTLRFKKELCCNIKSIFDLGLVYGVQGTVCFKDTSIIDDVGMKEKYVRNVIESAKKATVLSPNLVEYVHFYAKLLCEAAQEYDEMVKECDRALEVENLVDSASESLQEESQVKRLTFDTRISLVHSELKTLMCRAMIGSLYGLDQRRGEKKGSNMKKIPDPTDWKDFVQFYWNSITLDMKIYLFKINVSDIKEHTRKLSPEMQFVFPRDFLKNDIHLHLHKTYFTDSNSSEDVHDSAPQEKEMINKFESGGHDNISNRQQYGRGCNENLGYKTTFDGGSWPLFDDVECAKLLQKISYVLELLIKHKSLTESHLCTIIQFAMSELQSLDKTEEKLFVKFEFTLDSKKINIDENGGAKYFKSKKKKKKEKKKKKNRDIRKSKDVKAIGDNGLA